MRLIGDFDMAAIGHVRDATREVLAAGGHVVFDLGGVSFIDSTGLRFFLDLHRRSEQGELTFALRRARRAVHKTFEVTALDDVLDWEDD